jgi:hypothetical protein
MRLKHADGREIEESAYEEGTIDVRLPDQGEVIVSHAML